MKFIKSKCFEESTLRKVRNDDKTILYGLVGTVDDLLKVGVLERCDYDKELWLFIPAIHIQDFHFGKTRAEACEVIKEVN